MLTAMRPLLVGLLLAATSLTACSDDDDAAQATADRLAAALSDGRLPAGLFDGRPPQQAYDEVVEGLGGAEPDVEAGPVTEKDGTASAELTWTWELRGHKWRY